MPTEWQGTCNSLPGLTRVVDLSYLVDKRPPLPCEPSTAHSATHPKQSARRSARRPAQVIIKHPGPPMRSRRASRRPLPAERL